jgi:hypothetical protein
MPEMKLKQQNLIYSFKSTITCLEAKLNTMDKLENSFSDVKLCGKYNENLTEIKNDIQKVISSYLFC